MNALSEKILKLQGDGDYDGVVAFLPKRGTMDPTLAKDLARLADADILATLDADERRLLSSIERPIVLAARRDAGWRTEVQDRGACSGDGVLERCSFRTEPHQPILPPRCRMRAPSDSSSSAGSRSSIQCMNSKGEGRTRVRTQFRK